MNRWVAGMFCLVCVGALAAVSGCVWWSSVERRTESEALVSEKAVPPKSEQAPAPEELPPYRLVVRGEPELEDIVFPDAPPTKSVKVLADTPEVEFCTWQNSGVYLLPGDELYVRAEGHCTYAYDESTAYGVGPNGRGDSFPLALLPAVSFSALVGRTHGALLNDGKDSSGMGFYGPGFVGSAFHTIIPGGRTEGWLYLAMNDSTDGDNRGAFAVSIWQVRDGRVLKAE